VFFIIYTITHCREYKTHYTVAIAQNSAYIERMGSFDGTRLKNLMGERGLKTAWVAQKIGVTSSTLTRWMAGEMIPRADKLMALSRLLEVEPKDLFRVAS